MLVSPGTGHAGHDMMSVTLSASKAGKDDGEYRTDSVPRAKPKLERVCFLVAHTIVAKNICMSNRICIFYVTVRKYSCNETSA